MAALNGGYFNPSTCRFSGLCDTAICLLYGHGKSRRAKNRVAAGLLVGGVVKNEAQALLTGVHGNAGRVPSNAMPPEQIKLIERAIEASTVTNPVKNVLNVGMGA